MAIKAVAVVCFCKGTECNTFLGIRFVIKYSNQIHHNPYVPDEVENLCSLLARCYVISTGEQLQTYIEVH